MRERAEQILRIACLVLAAVVVYQLAGIARRLNPFHGVSVPALPALAAATNSPPGGGRGTNLCRVKDSRRQGNEPDFSGNQRRGDCGCCRHQFHFTAHANCGRNKFRRAT